MKGKDAESVAVDDFSDDTAYCSFFRLNISMTQVCLDTDTAPISARHIIDARICCREGGSRQVRQKVSGWPKLNNKIFNTTSSKGTRWISGTGYSVINSDNDVATLEP